MTLVFNGFNAWPLTQPWNVTVEPNDVDSESSGRTTMNARMERRIVAEKDKIVAKFPMLSQPEAQSLLGSVHGDFCRVNYTSPRYGERSNVEFYAKISPLTAAPPLPLPNRRGIAAWQNVEITLVER